MCKRQYAVPEMPPEIRMVFRCIEKKRGTGIEPVSRRIPADAGDIMPAWMCLR